VSPYWENYLIKNSSLSIETADDDTQTQEINEGMINFNVYFDSHVGLKITRLFTSQVRQCELVSSKQTELLGCQFENIRARKCSIF
jgi:hypothetical protein